MILGSVSIGGAYIYVEKDRTESAERFEGMLAPQPVAHVRIGVLNEIHSNGDVSLSNARFWVLDWEAAGEWRRWRERSEDG